MAILSFSSVTSLLKLSKNPTFSLKKTTIVAYPSLCLSGCSMPETVCRRFASLRLSAAFGEIPDQEVEEEISAASPKLADEWGDEYESEPITEVTKLADSDSPNDEDEWEEGDGAVEVADHGLRAGSDVRAEVSELVYQLEAANPTPAPLKAPELLNGTWILLYTASSELLPLLSAGSIPLVEVKNIKQTIDTNNLTIINSITLSNPFATLTFSASATFEVRSPTRIQVTFKEGALQPPDIRSRIDLPENVDMFGQKISLSTVQQTLSSLQEPVASISRSISGQPPLKIPIPGEITSSWLITTYLDEDLIISRGDGGLFILAREGSSLVLDQ